MGVRYYILYSFVYCDGCAFLLSLPILVFFRLQFVPSAPPSLILFGWFDRAVPISLSLRFSMEFEVFPRFILSVPLVYTVLLILPYRGLRVGNELRP